MKSINFLFVIAVLLLVSNVGFSQSSKSNAKAVKKTDKIDNELKSENPAYALSESQKQQIIALQTERMDEISAYRNNNSNKEEIKSKSKELNKAMNAKIKVILTDEQAKAQKSYRKKMKAEKGKSEKAGKKSKASKKSAKKKTKSTAMTVEEADKIYAIADNKQKAKAEKSTEKLNSKILASDASLALSPDQVKQINALNIRFLSESAEMEKAGATKEEIKDALKKNKRAISGILTKEQKKATKKK